MIRKALYILAVFVLYLLLAFFGQQDSLPPDTGVKVVFAGVPKPLGEEKNYDKIFTTLSSHGADGFFPTSQYQESPIKAVGYELDFFPPCTADSPAYAALRKSSVSFLVWGEMLYPEGNLPPLSVDPLKQIVECAGRDKIMGVVSYDEPWWRGLLEPSKKLYARVKEIDPTLPVIMVHGAMPAFTEENGVRRSTSEAEVDYYMSEVAKYKDSADVHGFDLYPIPRELGGYTSPSARGAVVGYEGIADYLNWLKENMRGKRYSFALQGASFGDGIVGWGDPASVAPRKPTDEELRGMLKTAVDNGATYIIWWGQSFLTDAADLAFWDRLLNVVKEFN